MERKKKMKKKGRHSYSASTIPSEFRVRLPRDGQVLGMVEIRLGMGKSRIRCTDGKVRICRVPGAIKRRVWVRQGDIALIEPWEIEGDRKGNIRYSYKPNEVSWLKKKGFLKELIEKDEF